MTGRLVLGALLSILVQHGTGTVISFSKDGPFDERYVERDQQVNTLYHTWLGYGLDCYHHINQQFELRLYFRGLPVAGATVTSCAKSKLASTLKIRPFGGGVHHFLVCTDDSCNMYNVPDPYKGKEGGQERLDKPVTKLEKKEGICSADWCSFTDTDITLKNEVFYFGSNSGEIHDLGTIS